MLYSTLHGTSSVSCTRATHVLLYAPSSTTGMPSLMSPIGVWSTLHALGTTGAIGILHSDDVAVSMTWRSTLSTTSSLCGYLYTHPMDAT